MKILVLRGGALGDFIVTLPALHLLKGRWPEAQITLVGNATAAKLGLADGVLTEAYSQHEARWAALYGSDPLPALLREWLETFDLVLSFWPDPEGELCSRFPLRSAQRFIAGPAKPSAGPAAAHFCAVLGPLGLVAGEITPRLRLPSLKYTADSTQVSLHPGSSSPERNWPVDRWAEVAAELRRRGFRVLIIAGECDLEAAERLSPYGEVLVEPPLLELARRLARGTLHLGHDTGVSHLAAALGLPCVVLFGPTDPGIWAPQSPLVKILRRGSDLASISTTEVLEQLPLSSPSPFTSSSSTQKCQAQKCQAK